ncbi:hypothetical protein GOODEAATRI_014341, partial [Goodea atripinnis]
VSTEACNPDDEMGMTFGCSLKDCRHLLESAKELGVEVVGVRHLISSDVASCPTCFKLVKLAKIAVRGTGLCLHMLELSLWVSRCSLPQTQHHPLSTMSYLLETVTSSHCRKVTVTVRRWCGLKAKGSGIAS